MITNDLRELTKSQNMIQTIIWAAFIMFILILTFVAYVSTQDKAAIVISDVENIDFIVTLVAILVGSLSLFVHLMVNSDKVITKFLKQEISVESFVASASQQQVNPARLDQIKKLSNEELKLYKLSNQLFTFVMIKWALNESVAILGFVLALSARDFTVMLPFAVGAICLQVIMFPNLNKLLEKSAQLVTTVNSNR